MRAVNGNVSVEDTFYSNLDVGWCIGCLHYTIRFLDYGDSYIAEDDFHDMLHKGKSNAIAYFENIGLYNVHVLGYEFLSSTCPYDAYDEHTVEEPYTHSISIVCEGKVSKEYLAYNERMKEKDV